MVNLIPNSNGEPDHLEETWSDAARAASLASRRAKAKGQDWRKAGRHAFTAHATDSNVDAMLSKLRTRSVATISPKSFGRFKQRVRQRNALATRVWMRPNPTGRQPATPRWVQNPKSTVNLGRPLPPPARWPRKNRVSGYPF